MSDLSAFVGMTPDQLADMQRWNTLGAEMSGLGFTLPEGEFVTNSVTDVDGQRHYLTNLGGVYSPDGGNLGSYLGLPDADRQGDRGGGFQRIEALPSGGYTIISPNGERYEFGRPSSPSPSLPMPTTPSPQVATVPTTTQSASAFLRQTLDQYGLGSLTDWANQQIVSGVSEDQLMIDLRQRPEYESRFAGMRERRENGLPSISESQYLAFEETAAYYLQRAGLPDTFYDDPTDYAHLIGRFVNPQQIAERVGDSYMRVAQAPREIRDAFGELYGAQGDDALAMFFLDPDRSMPTLERMVLGAEVYGVGRRYGQTLTRQMTERLADLGVDRAEAERGFQFAADAMPLTIESVGEGTDDITEEDAVNAAFNVDGTASRERLRRRAESRAAAFGGGGGALTSITEGVLGLGEAD